MSEDKKRKTIDMYKEKFGGIFLIIGLFVGVFGGGLLCVAVGANDSPATALGFVFIPTILIWGILTGVYFKLHYNEFKDSQDENLEELERRKIIEAKYAIWKENEAKEENKEEDEFRKWVDSVEKNKNCYKNKEYITFTAKYDSESRYNYTKFFFWYEDNKFFLYCPSTEKVTYDKGIFKNGGIISANNVILNKNKGIKTYTKNPKQEAAINGAFWGGVTGAIIGASSTDKTLEYVSYETREYICSIKIGEFKEYITEKDYEIIEKIVRFNSGQ